MFIVYFAKNTHEGKANRKETEDLLIYYNKTYGLEFTYVVGDDCMHANTCSAYEKIVWEHGLSLSLSP